MERRAKTAWMGGAGLAVALVVGLAHAQLTVPSLDAERVRRNEAWGMRNVVRGRVVDANGKPFPGIRVVARFDQGRTGASGEGAATTGDDGRYEIRGLGGYGFNVVALGPKPHLLDAPPRHVDLRHAVAADGIDFAVVPGPRVHVRVRDLETGEGVPDLAITLQRLGSEEFPSPGRTDARGEATFVVGLREAGVGVVLGPESGVVEDFASLPWSHEVREKEPSSLDWTKWVLRKKPWSVKTTFRAEVVDPEGRPVAGAKVRMWRFQAQEAHIATTDAKGRVAIPAFGLQSNEPPGPPVHFVAERGEIRGEAMVSRTEVWRPARVVVHPGATARLIGRIVDAEGRPLARARLQGYEYFEGSTTEGGGMDTRWADDEGRFEFPVLWPSGRYYFGFGQEYARGRLGLIALPRRDAKPWYLTFRPGEVRDLGTIVVPHADHSVAGVLVGADGKAIAYDVLLELKGEHTDVNASLDAAGRFRFEGVVDEPLTLRLYTGNENAYSTGPHSPDLLLERAVTVGEGALRLQVEMRPPLHPARTIRVPSGP